MVSRRKTIGALSKPCYGSCTPAARGATRLRNSDIGTGRSFASYSGARRASESALRRRCLGEAELAHLFIDSNVIRAHQHSAGAEKNTGGQEIGRSRGGLTTKLHAAVDALGNSVWVILTAGQIADVEEAEALIKDQPVEFVVADKGTTPTPPSRQSLHRTAKRLSRRAPIGLQPVHSLGTSTKAAI